MIYQNVPAKCNECPSLVTGEYCQRCEDGLLINKDVKDYKDKLNYVPLQWEAIEAVAKVFKYAEKKYGNNNSWRSLDETSRDKYLNALMRHMVEIMKGNEIDPESGLPHIYAVAWNALTSAYIQIKGSNNESKSNT